MTNADRWSPIVAAAVVLLAGIALIDALPIGVVHDDAMYVILAKAIATGQGLHWLNIPGAPPATHYPPGFPALLSVVWRLFPEFPGNIVAFKALNALLLALAAAALVVFARRRLDLSPLAACLVAIAGCLAIPTLVLSTVVMSETFFLALLVPALVYAERAHDRLTTDDASLAPALTLGAIAGALLLVRTHAIAFAVAAAVALLIARRFRALAAYAAALVVVVLPWQLWAASHRGAVPVAMRGDYESYGGWLREGAAGHPIAFMLRTLALTTRELFATIVGMTSAGLPTVALRLFGALAAIGLVIAGLVVFARRARVTALFIAAYFAVVLCWPFSVARFVWGIWALLLITFVAGAVWLKDWRPSASWRRVARGVGFAGVAAVVAGYGMYTARGLRGRWWSSIGRQVAAVSIPSIVWVEEHTQPTDVVASNAELMIYLYTGRQAVPATRLSAGDYFGLPSAQSRGEALRSILGAYRVDAVAIIANDSLEAAARRMAAEQPPALSLRDSVPHGLIFSSMVR